MFYFKQTQRFTFGKNWKRFAQSIDDKSIDLASSYLQNWLGDQNSKARIIDIGCGSGLFSLAMYRKTCQEIVSFDYDTDSVDTTNELWHREGSPENWHIFSGSILDADLVQHLGQFDIVHCWGVLHHTGDMWKALDNTLKLMKPGGLLLMAIYAKGPSYEKHLKIKLRYNRASFLLRRYMELNYYLIPLFRHLFKHRENFSNWNARNERGMLPWFDMFDWLGGLPYEVASVDEIITFCKERGLDTLKCLEAGEGGCSEYLLRKPA
jgi:2-polyprenyl-6-hydroxyphenyl methylase/3-demethylubiquinone-9 3-methyltransferase